MSTYEPRRISLAAVALAATLALTTGCPSDAVTNPDAVADAAEDTAADSIAVADSVADTPADAAADAVTDTAADAVADVIADTATDVATDSIADTAADMVADAAPDASTPTSTVFGPISGPACGGLDDALTSPDPSFWVSTWSMDLDTFDPTLLDQGPAYRFSQPNAGGSSMCSEVMSMEWLVECEDAEFYKTETEISYATAGTITDYEVLINGHKIGVSVTRAYLGPYVTDYTVADADKLLHKKLTGVVASSANVAPEDAWTKQILHIWTLQPSWIPTLRQSWEGLPAAEKADTIVLVTVEDGTDYVVTDTCDDTQ